MQSQRLFFLLFGTVTFGLANGCEGQHRRFVSGIRADAGSESNALLPSATSDNGMVIGRDAGVDGAALPFCDSATLDCPPPCLGCVIDGECVADGAIHPTNKCQFCDSMRTNDAWSNREDIACDDGLFCTTDDTCVEGLCTGVPRECDDGVECNGVSQCEEASRDCRPGVAECPNGSICDVQLEICTTTCTGCTIAGSCIPEGAEQPGNPCMVCNPASSDTTYTAVVGKACGAGPDLCSLQDTCDASGVCQPNHVQAGSSCGNAAGSPCDQPDTCDGNGTCQSRLANNGTVCNDGQFCTTGDECQGGACLPTAARNCGVLQTCDEASDSCQCQGCTVSDVCLARGTVNPNNPCQICDPARNNAGFSPNGGALCGVGPTECSAQDTCSNQGVCIPNHVAAGTRCGAFSNACVNPDQCNGSGVCQSRVAQRVEVCDNVDNDCDGANNEGVDLSTDPNNCGACGRSCLGGACVSGNCQPFALVTSRTQPNDILVDANNVYWIDSAGVSRFPKNPSGASVVQTIPSVAASSLQRDGAKLYWATPRTIVRGNTDGTALENFVPNRPGNIQGTFLSDGFVYWLESSTISAGGLDYRRALLSNPVPETFGGESDETARLLGTQGDCIYYARNATTDITRSCAVTGGFNLFFPHIVRGFHVDGAAISDVYVASQGRGIVRLPASGVPERIVVASSSGLGDVKADGTHIYYVDGPSSSVACTTNGALSRIRKSGGAAQLVAPAQPCFGKMAIDTDAIYWTNFQGGQIMKMAKPAL